MVKAVRGEERKMDFELPGRIMKPAGTARYSSRVFMALSGVPAESLPVTAGRNRVVTRLSTVSRKRGGFLFAKSAPFHGIL